MSEAGTVGKRARKAVETRRRMLAAARELFIERGYGATALQEIADRAGVAVQTIYFTFGNKRTLLKEVVDVSIAGDDEPIATMDRHWFRDMLAAKTADAQLRILVHNVREILARVSPIIEMVRAAAAIDPDVPRLWGQDPDPRYTVLETAAKTLLTKPDARGGTSVPYAADVLFGLLSPELYLLFVRDRGWSSQQWEQWAVRILRAQLCSD